MNTIKNSIEHEIIIKNSRFITVLEKVYDKKKINYYLDEIKKKYPKATHYCYAYIIDQDKKSSDDGEPGGTAGIPILSLLEKEELNYILAVVVRYFGGIKLGASGLVRAYTKSVKGALDNTNILSLVEGVLINITTDYSNQKQLEYLLKDATIIKKEFLEQITYEVLIEKEKLTDLELYSYKIIENKLIEKGRTL